MHTQTHRKMHQTTRYIHSRLVKIARFLRSINRHEKDRFIDSSDYPGKRPETSMTHCFMTGRPPTCSNSTDVPVVPSLGKLQTTLKSHAGRQGDHLPTTIDSCFTPLPRVGCYNTVCRKLHRASPPPPVSAALNEMITRCRGTLQFT